MDRQAQERVVPEVTQFALVIAKGQTTESDPGDDEGVESLFGGFSRFGFHFLGEVEQRVCQETEHSTQFLVIRRR